MRSLCHPSWPRAYFANGYRGAVFALHVEDGQQPDGPNDKDQLIAWRTAWKRNFSEWLGQAVATAFPPDTAPERIQATIQMMMQCTVQTAIETDVALAETDFRRELPNFKVPTLILHAISINRARWESLDAERRN